MNKVAIIGAGIMGHGIAQVCAQGKKTVVLIDAFEQALENSKVKIKENVQLLIENGLVENDTLEAILERITYSSKMEDAKDSEIVIEVVPERANIKKDVFGQLSKICSEKCILTTNTSGTPITEIAQMCTHPERVIGSHFFQPAHLIPIVEIIQTDLTDKKVIEETIKFIEEIGKVPAHIKKDIPGFVANRLQHALSREAMSLVQKGIVSTEDLDKIVIGSFAPRMVFTGPMGQRDMNGLDTHIFVNEYLYKDLEDAKEPLQIIKDKVAEGALGVKAGKGFYDWTGQSAIDIYNKKNDELIGLFKFLKAREKK